MATAVNGRPLQPVVVSILFGYGAVWGTLTIIGRGDRWAGPTFEVARQIVGGPSSWGTALLLFSVAGFVGVGVGRRSITQAALVSAGVWSVVFAICLAAAVAVNPQAALTGSATWLFHAALFLAAARRVRWA